MQQRSEETRAAIQAAALKLFSQSGYDATGVAEICTMAGVSKGAFYHHYPTKQAVFLSLLEAWLAGLDMEMQILFQGAHNVPQALLDIAGMTNVVFEAADGRLTMFLEFWRQASRDPAVWETTIAPYHRYQKIFAGFIQAGIDEGSLRPIDPDVAARTVLAFAIGMLLQGLLDPKGEAWDQATREGIQLLLEGMQRRS